MQSLSTQQLRLSRQPAARAAGSSHRAAAAARVRPVSRATAGDEDVLDAELEEVTAAVEVRRRPARYRVQPSGGAAVPAAVPPPLQPLAAAHACLAAPVAPSQALRLENEKLKSRLVAEAPAELGEARPVRLLAAPALRR